MIDEPDIFEPDKNRLDEELVKQPRLYHQYADQLADARRDHEMAESEMKVVEAEVSLLVRRRPDRFGIEKVTEDAVKKTVLLDKRVRQAEKEVILAKHKVDLLSAAVTALDHRKRVLEKLVDLRLADYYAEPRTREAREMMERSRERNSSGSKPYKRD